MLKKDSRLKIESFNTNSIFLLGNGVIDFPEFVKLMEIQKKPDEREADMMLAFRIFDADNKGYIESAELRYILLNMDKRIPQEEIKELMEIADLERDRKISYQGTREFPNIINLALLKINNMDQC